MFLPAGGGHIFLLPECQQAPRRGGTACLRGYTGAGPAPTETQHKSGLALQHLGSCASSEPTREGNQAPQSKAPRVTCLFQPSSHLLSPKQSSLVSPSKSLVCYTDMGALLSPCWKETWEKGTSIMCFSITSQGPRCPLKHPKLPCHGAGSFFGPRHCLQPADGEGREKGSATGNCWAGKMQPSCPPSSPPRLGAIDLGAFLK